MIRNAWLALLVLVPLGCDVHHAPVLELHQADLVTPTGRVPLEVGTERHRPAYASNNAQEMIVTHEDLMIRVRVLPGVQHMLVDSSSAAHRVEVVRDDAYYQRNGGVKQPVSFQTTGVNSEPQYHVRFDFELPPPLALFHIYDGAMLDQSTNKIEMREDDVHVLYLPFLVDAQLFAIDLEFSIEIETRRFLGAPGSP